MDTTDKIIVIWCVCNIFWITANMLLYEIRTAPDSPLGISYLICGIFFSPIYAASYLIDIYAKYIHEELFKERSL